ncbi:hypothetical protein ACFQ9Y_25165 [Peribacillus simplex]|uniref:hypothetical protein n=1 Tax=Peribacillus simplex TaxID=1478 RepID=UPI00367081F8
MKRETVSTYEDGCADQAERPMVGLCCKIPVHYALLSFEKEVLFMLGAPFFSRLIRKIKSVERRKNAKNQLENYLFCHFTAFCPKKGNGHAYHGGLFTH